RVARVVGVHQVDPAGDRLDPVHRRGEVLPARVRVAGVQAEPGAVLADHVPQPGQRVEPPGAGVVPAGGVLDQDRHREAPFPLGVLEGLAPVVDAGGEIVAAVGVTSVDDQPPRTERRRTLRVVEQQLAAGDADAVVEGRDVDAVRRVDEDVQRSGADRIDVLAGRWRLPPLWLGEEELHHVGVAGSRLRERITPLYMCTDAHDAQDTRRVRHGTGVGHVDRMSARTFLRTPAGRTHASGRYAERRTYADPRPRPRHRSR